jgi:hypothetical protein
LAVVPEKVLELVSRYSEFERQYADPRYKEARARVDFIDPFFEALKWDVRNTAGLPEGFRDVVVEDSIHTGAPDYSFWIGGRRKFFVEAKKPAENIMRNQSHAHQLRRYSWSAGLPVSILTDFEEFAVYDCRTEPSRDDAVGVGRVLTFQWHEYADRWEEIESLFSRDAVASGSLDRFATVSRRRGTAAVDEVFLSEIESWRELLAREVADANGTLDKYALNFAVQSIIDRVIFLRICEDRGIEEFGQLQQVAASEDAYEALKSVFVAADARYNSGLFHFRPERGREGVVDTITPCLAVPDAVLKRIISRLYLPLSPYEFAVLPGDILGQVYEQFLGKVIGLTDGHAEVEFKPEVRKAGGVWYTPTHIVDYSVRRVLDPILKRARPVDLDSLAILDPSCGSGSFLIGAYQHLLDWHLHWYSRHDPEKWLRGRLPKIYQGPAGTPRLTIAEKRRILLNCIYGVDIDSQAVEVTKLSLLLKVLEGENHETINSQMALFRERVLPDLDCNIRCGNSLVDADFHATGQMGLLGEDAKRRVNPFDWASEYSDVHGRGGFDVIIGNPPYIFGEYLDANVKQYMIHKYVLAARQFDTYALFLERSMSLLRPEGSLAMIVPDAVLARDDSAETRRMLLENGLAHVYHCGLVFGSAVSAVVLVTMGAGRSGPVVSEVRDVAAARIECECDRNRFQQDPLHRLLVHSSDDEQLLIDQLAACSVPLSEYVTISRGEEVGKKKVLERGTLPILVGEDIGRYEVRQPRHFVEKVNKTNELYEAPKIVIVKTGVHCIAALDTVGYVTMQSVYNLTIENGTVAPEAIVGLLNSRLVDFYIQKTFTAYKLLFPQMNQSTVLGIPVPALNTIQDALTPKVREMQSLLASPLDRVDQVGLDMHRRRLRACQWEIDELVFDAFELSPTQRALINSA